jgi:hypothetical protein
MAYSNYLLKANGTEITPAYIQLDTYKVTPNQRLEISAERDTDGVLVRSTVSHKPTKIEFKTPSLTSTQMAALTTILTNAFSNVQERKLSLNYYVPDLDAYQTGNFYVPDIEFTIYRIISSSVLQYDPTRIAFIEY